MTRLQMKLNVVVFLKISLEITCEHFWPTGSTTKIVVFWLLSVATSNINGFWLICVEICVFCIRFSYVLDYPTIVHQITNQSKTSSSVSKHITQGIHFENSHRVTCHNCSCLLPARHSTTQPQPNRSTEYSSPKPSTVTHTLGTRYDKQKGLSFNSLVSRNWSAEISLYNKELSVNMWLSAIKLKLYGRNKWKLVHYFANQAAIH